MARTPEWEALDMAVGDPKPAWPLPGTLPKFATWSIGGGRPYACELDKCERWHAGIDLTGAKDGALVLAPEDALVVGIDRPWSEGSRAAFLRADSGLFLVLGGFKHGSHKEFGVVTGGRVKKGDKLGRILGSYGMIHLEAYRAASRTANSVWWKSEPAPDGLLNPTNYVERMVGDKVSMLQTRQRHEALATLGFYRGDVAAAWGPASEAALRDAQTKFGIAVDGKWGPQTEDAIHAALAKTCPSGSCTSIAEPPPTTTTDTPATTSSESTDALASLGRVGWLLIGGVALTTAAIGVGVMLFNERRP